MKWMIILTILFALYGCNNYDNKTINDLKKEIESLETTLAEGEHFLYIVDASCSVCISDAICFIMAYNRSRISTPCNMFVSDSYKDVFAYYLGQHITKTNVQILYLYEEYPFGILAPGVLYKTDNNNSSLIL